MKTGIDYIKEERDGHECRGYGASHDDGHDHCELLKAARQLLLLNDTSLYLEGEISDDVDMWGIARHHDGDDITQLAIAGSLIAAEIDRRLRNNESAAPKESPDPTPAA